MTLSVTSSGISTNGSFEVIQSSCGIPRPSDTWAPPQHICTPHQGGMPVLPPSLPLGDPPPSMVGGGRSSWPQGESALPGVYGPCNSPPGSVGEQCTVMHGGSVWGPSFSQPAHFLLSARQGQAGIRRALRKTLLLPESVPLAHRPTWWWG